MQTSPVMLGFRSLTGVSTKTMRYVRAEAKTGSEDLICAGQTKSGRVFQGPHLRSAQQLAERAERAGRSCRGAKGLDLGCFLNWTHCWIGKPTKCRPHLGSYGFQVNCDSAKASWVVFAALGGCNEVSPYRYFPRVVAGNGPWSFW